jgi:hypothetical protein
MSLYSFFLEKNHHILRKNLKFDGILYYLDKFQKLVTI